MNQLVLLFVGLIVYLRVIPALRLVWKTRNSPLPGFYGCAMWLWGRVLFKPSGRWNVQQISLWWDKGSHARRLGMNAYYIHSLWQGHSFLYLSDPAAVKEVVSKATLYAKPVRFYVALGWYGPNLVATIGDDWRRHRKVSGPAFGEDFNKSVWQQAVRYTDEWLDRLPPANAQGQHVVEVTHAVHTVMLLVISAAGFGCELAWPGEEGDLPAHHKMPFLTAMQGMFDNLILKAATPSLFWRLPLASVRRINGYFASFEEHVLEMVDERRALGAQGVEKGDLLSRLIAANDAEEGSARLADKELLSNIHIFLLAGHETTSHTLMATLMLLALYQDDQEAIANEARAAFAGGEGAPGYDAFGELRLTTATFMEGLRLFPAACLIPKESARESSLTVHTIPQKQGEEPVPVTVQLPAGTKVRIDVAAIQYSTVYWGEDAAEFRPARFIDSDACRWPRDAFLAFSAGARGCIGRQAAVVEATAFLARVVARYRIEPPADRAEEWKRRPGESEVDRRERIYKPKHGITLAPQFPLNIALVPRE